MPGMMACAENEPRISARKGIASHDTNARRCMTKLFDTVEGAEESLQVCDKKRGIQTNRT